MDDARCPLRVARIEEVGESPLTSPSEADIPPTEGAMPLPKQLEDPLFLCIPLHHEQDCGRASGAPRPGLHSAGIPLRMLSLVVHGSPCLNPSLEVARFEDSFF